MKETTVDTGEMQELLQSYLAEMNWAGGATKDAILSHLAGRDEALRTMVNEYVAEGTYQGMGEVMTLIPVQAWQDAQGDDWRGPTSLDPDDVDSGFQASPAGQDAGGNATTGMTSSPVGGAQSASGTTQAGSNAGEVDPGLSIPLDVEASQSS
jgi:hypothetical protein